MKQESLAFKHGSVNDYDEMDEMEVKHTMNVGKIFANYDEMEAKYDELRRYGKIIDDEAPHYDGTFWHRKTMYLYDDKVWLVSMVGGGIEYLLDVTTLTRIEGKED